MTTIQNSIEPCSTADSAAGEEGIGGTGADGESVAGKQSDGPVEFWLDADDRIAAVNRGWREFAHANGADQLTAECVIGRRLREFISGDVTRMFVDTLLQSTRLTGRERIVQYRCDSPEIKRYMEMHLQPQADGGMVARHLILHEERLPAPVSFLTLAGRQDAALIKRCSMCNRVARRAGTPLLEPEVAQRKGWFDGERPAGVIYFVCADCQRRVFARRGGVGR